MQVVSFSLAQNSSHRNVRVVFTTWERVHLHDICIYLYIYIWLKYVPYIKREHKCIADDFSCSFCVWLTVSGWVYRSKHTPVTLAVMQALHILSSFSNRIYRLIFHSEQSIHHVAYLFTIGVACTSWGIRSLWGWSGWLFDTRCSDRVKQGELPSIWHHVRLQRMTAVEALCCI